MFSQYLLVLGTVPGAGGDTESDHTLSSTSYLSRSLGICALRREPSPFPQTSLEDLVSPRTIWLGTTVGPSEWRQSGACSAKIPCG